MALSGLWGLTADSYRPDRGHGLGAAGGELIPRRLRFWLFGNIVPMFVGN